MAISSSTRALPSNDAYRLWAASYDDELNPMLLVEQACLEPLLPPVKGLDVMDIGCGTGRWLQKLHEGKPRTLLGIDSSPEMLDRARKKVGSAAKYLQADCRELTLPALSADLIVGSFLLSYVEDLPPFLHRLASFLRPGGSIFLSDLHPTTVAALHWRRGFNVDGSFNEVETYPQPLEDVIAFAERERLRVASCIEPHFGEAEQCTFEAAGKSQAFHEAEAHPAIYILQLKKEVPAAAPRSLATPAESLQTLHGARIALGPQRSIHGTVGVEGDRVQYLDSRSQCAPRQSPLGVEADLSGFLLLPGLVNAHDHLEFALFPRMGKGGYRNFLEWAEDIHSTEHSVISEHRQVSREVRMWWGGIRNLACGVTTVCHHNPYEPEIFDEGFVIRVLREYGWAHSLSLEPDVSRKKRNTPKGLPFILHLAEGVDASSASEIDALCGAGALDEETVIVHGLALGRHGRELVRRAGAGLIWCPTSNIFLFGQTLSADQLRSLPQVALGSDSSLTADGDLLDEIRYAHQVAGISSDYLYSSITRSAAAMLRLDDGEGGIRPGGIADLIAVRDTGLSPADSLMTLSHKEIELVLVGGQVQLASQEMMQRLPDCLTSDLQMFSLDGIQRWIRAPLFRLWSETVAHLPGEIRLGGKQVGFGPSH